MVRYKDWEKNEKRKSLKDLQKVWRATPQDHLSILQKKKQSESLNTNKHIKK